MESGGESNSINVLVIALVFISSLALLFGSAFILKELAILYGYINGAAAQAIATNTLISNSVASVGAVSQIGTIQYGIQVSYILGIIGLAVTAAAFIMLVKRHDRLTVSSDRYVVVHAVLVIVFTLVLYLIIGQFSVNPDAFYMYVTYAGIGICLICDVYLEIAARRPQASRSAKIRRTISIDPAKPFSNMLNLQENLFSNLSGHLRIVDKHFNSTALANLHRMIGGVSSNYTRITILTSREMLDSGIARDVPDFRNELGRSGIGLEIRLMDETDAMEQHERMILDDKVAYKVPPLNIINKRSEHITTISHREAMSRFNKLYERGIKLENYQVKQARESNPEPSPPPQQ